MHPVFALYLHLPLEVITRYIFPYFLDLFCSIILWKYLILAFLALLCEVYSLSIPPYVNHRPGQVVLHQSNITFVVF
jgi:hypothetical protein